MGCEPPSSPLTAETEAPSRATVTSAPGTPRVVRSSTTRPVRGSPGLASKAAGRPEEAARRVERDVKGVHGDVVALLAAGLLARTEEGLIEFPYESVKVEFLLQAA